MQPDDDDTLACLLPSIYYEVMVQRHLIEKPKKKKHKKDDIEIRVDIKKKDSNKVVFHFYGIGVPRKNRPRFKERKKVFLS